MGKKHYRSILYIIGGILAVCTAFPIIYMLANSVMSAQEIIESYQVSAGEYMNFHLVPGHFSLEQYYRAFFREPDFLYMFWNSVIYAVPAVAGQTVISIFAGYAFAKLRFPGRDKLFFISVILLLLPIQVTIVPNYIILNKLGLLDRRLSLILPAVFSAFGVCLLRQSIRSLSNECIESARMDGAGEMRILSGIVLPQIKGGIASVILLSFIEVWNMIEQPLIYLKDEAKYPLSLYLSTVNDEKTGISFACGVIFMIPVMLLYLYFRQEFTQSIFQEEDEVYEKNR